MAVHRSPPLLVFVTAGVLLGGCALDEETSLGDPPPSSGAPLLVPAEASYALEATADGWVGAMDFAYTNTTAEVVSLLNCRDGFGVKLERWQDSEWQWAWSPVLLSCLSPPIEIPPGETYDFTLSVFAGYPGGNSYPMFAFDEIEGYYRLVVTSAYWNYHDSPPWGDELPLSDRASNPFALTVD
jgi:hypothetical protein